MDKFHNSNNFASSSRNSSNEKSIDADSMIKNIISQQDTFVVNKEHQLYSDLPKWMMPKSGFVHPLYEQIWQYVKSDKRDRTCDTNLVSQLLMTSGLPVDVLGGLWSMANIGVDGSLSQQELYIILALITLVQNGYSVSNVSLLQHIHKPIIPQLNYTLIEKKQFTSTIKSVIEQKSQQVTNKSSIMPKINHNNQQQNIYVNNFQQPNFNNLIPPEDYDPLAVTFIEPKSQMSRIITPLAADPEPKSLDLAPVNDSFETFDDEFSDFQCAQFTSTDNKNNHEFTDFQSAFDSLSFKENTITSNQKDIELLNVLPINVSSNLTNQSPPNLISYKDNTHDKYEVFRNLVAETVDKENVAIVKENLTDDKENLFHNKENLFDDKEHLTDDKENLTVENNNQDLLDVKNSIEDNIQIYDVYDDEFGDFLCVEEVSRNKPEIEVDWKNVQIQCINKCLEFLHDGFYTFSNISDKKILMEVINHDKGVKYLTQLNLISQICRRILKNCYCSSSEENLTEVMSKLETYLNNLTDESINNSEDLDPTKETVQCYLCKSNCQSDPTEYLLNHYHSSCINLLMNFVQTSQLSVK